ncbi:MAG: MBL fold metallo-hydrolase [Ornithinimicrobium sp.]
MIVHTLPAAAFGTNCYVLAQAAGADCIIVDPGIGVADRVAEVLRQEGLSPAAILLTHGHLDHVYDVPILSAAGAVTTHIHGLDRYRLANPLGDLDRSFIAMMEAQFGTTATWREPEAVVELATDSAAESFVRVADLTLGVKHAPGHTEGSVLFTVDDLPDDPRHRDGGLDRTVLSGDVLFAGSIGRTDLPGGDSGAMIQSLRDVVMPLADSALVLPGHGPATTMAIERRSNPYLQRPLL